MTAKDRLEKLQTATDGEYDLKVIKETLSALQADLFDLLELVRSIPNDDPKFEYWRGYHQAQVDISKKIIEYTAANALKDNKHEVV